MLPNPLPSTRILPHVPPPPAPMPIAAGQEIVPRIDSPATSQDPDLMGSAPVDPGVGVSPGHVRLDLGLCHRSGDAPLVATLDGWPARLLPAPVDSSAAKSPPR